MTTSDTMSTSSLPASTSSSSPSASSTPNTSHGGFFSSGGSPALVLAFLAIGIFAGGLISMIFLRRLALRHLFRRSWTREENNWDVDWTAMLAGQGQRRKHKKRIGEKPKLWDVDGRSLSVMKSSRGWEYVLPLSAAYAEREPPPPLAEQDPLLPPEPVPQPSRLTSLLPWAKSPTIPLPLPSPPPDYDSTPGSLQVGVAIIMPLQLDGSDRRPDGAARVPLFELGFVEFPWSDEKQDLCLPRPTTPDLQDQEGGPSTETT